MEITTLENFDAVALSSFPYGKSVCLNFRRIPCGNLITACRTYGESKHCAKCDENNK